MNSLPPATSAPPAAPPIRVMLVEDNRAYRDALGLALEAVDDLRLLHQFATAEMALRQLEAHWASPPAVILLDLRLPGMGGLEALPLLQRAAPAARIVMLTQSDREEDVLRAITLGAAGYLLKSAGVGEIVEGIRLVHAGEATIDAKVAKLLLTNLRVRLPAVESTIELSPREQEILVLLSEGLVKKEIAAHLNISYTTVDTHVRHIYEKLQVTNAPAAVNKAYKLGIFWARRDQSGGGV